MVVTWQTCTSPNYFWSLYLVSDPVVVERVDADVLVENKEGVVFENVVTDVSVVVCVVDFATVVDGIDADDAVDVSFKVENNFVVVALPIVIALEIVGAVVSVSFVGAILFRSGSAEIVVKMFSTVVVVVSEASSSLIDAELQTELVQQIWLHDLKRKPLL